MKINKHELKELEGCKRSVADFEKQLKRFFATEVAEITEENKMMEPRIALMAANENNCNCILNHGNHG